MICNSSECQARAGISGIIVVDKNAVEKNEMMWMESYFSQGHAFIFEVFMLFR